MRRGLPLLALALLLTGCGADKPVTQLPPRAYAPPPPAVAAASADNAPASADDPLTASGGTSDPLIGGAGRASHDPLIGENSPKGPRMPHLHSQPLSGQDTDVDDSTLLMNGQTMPTRNTHWLGGMVRDARVTVLLNGIRAGDFAGLVVRDITPRLRPGINTVTFVYQPNSPHSYARISVQEGEHTPAIPPLATFDAAPTASLSTPDTPKPQTQTVTFTAR